MAVDIDLCRELVRFAEVNACGFDEDSSKLFLKALDELQEARNLLLEALDELQESKKCIKDMSEAIKDMQDELLPKI